jgi:hypothetical protein
LGICAVLADNIILTVERIALGASNNDADAFATRCLIIRQYIVITVYYDPVDVLFHNLVRSQRVVVALDNDAIGVHLRDLVLS